MRVAFMGTPGFAATSLEALLDSRHEVVAVVSQPDRPAGRGNRMVTPPVARLAREHGLPLRQPERISGGDLRDWLRAWEPEVIVVAAYGHILRRDLLGLAPRGCLNVHASLLPRWRGASPIQAAILAGDAESGVTLMQMDEGLDTGDVLTTARVPIRPEMTGAHHLSALAEVGARLLLETLDALEAGEVARTAQDDARATYAPMLGKADGDLDWTRPADAIERRIRALHPWPGTRARHTAGPGAEPRWLKVHPPAGVRDETGDEAPGTVVSASSEGVDVRCGDGRLVRLRRLQAPGKRALDAEAFLAGYDLPVGSRLA